MGWKQNQGIGSGRVAKKTPVQEETPQRKKVYGVQLPPELSIPNHDIILKSITKNIQVGEEVVMSIATDEVEMGEPSTQDIVAPESTQV
jgi:hypothetical protein